MFHATIWLEHDREASAHEEPITQIRAQLSTMQANLETLRTRVNHRAGERCLGSSSCCDVMRRLLDTSPDSDKVPESLVRMTAATLSPITQVLYYTPQQRQHMAATPEQRISNDNPHVRNFVAWDSVVDKPSS